MNMNCDENQLVCTQMSTNLKKKKKQGLLVGLYTDSSGAGGFTYSD